MLKKETAPSESEWQIMGVFWSAGTSLTSSEVILRLKKYTDMTPRMARVLMNRLCQKKLLSYVIDENDARIYIYTPLRSREECLEEKSRRFADSYFSGSYANAAAALLKNTALTEAQMEELKGILETCKGRHSETGRDKKMNKRKDL